MEKLAVEHIVLDGLKKYIEDVVEYSDTLAEVHNDIFDIEQRQKRDHDDAMENTSEKVNDLHYDIQDDIDSLQQQIDELKDAIEDLKEKS
tara:strand:+ start:5 stop:274 length:270 start_codon:yes stop_codon:yes gene_type:complete